MEIVLVVMWWIVQKLVRKDIRGLTQEGRDRLRKFKDIWVRSERYNPLLTDYVVSKRTRGRVLKCLREI